MTLPPAFVARPIAHRALHDAGDGRLENSLPAIRAAVAAGYGIEIDLQRSRDDVPIVFHDYDLKRLTIEQGAVAGRSAAELQRIPLNGGSGTIPTLEQVLDAVDGKVPLLIEIKDQDGGMGADVGRMGRNAADLLARYDGPVALMSFNPHHIAEMARLLPDVPRGLTTDRFERRDWPTIPVHMLDRLRDIPDFDHVGSCFISHHHLDLASPRVTELRQQGATILCWTIRTPDEAAATAGLAHNITFEGFAA